MPADLSDSPEDQQLVEAFAAMAPTLDALFAVCMCVCGGACVCVISPRRSASLSVIPSLKLMYVCITPPHVPTSRIWRASCPTTMRMLLGPLAEVMEGDLCGVGWALQEMLGQ